MFIAHIGGMDALARGLRGAVKLVEEGHFYKEVKKRYATWDEVPLAKKVKLGEATLEEVAEHAKNLKEEPKILSSKQEYLEQLLNRYI